MLKEKLKNIDWLRKSFIKLQAFYFSALTYISPVLNTKARYRAVNKKKLNLKNPETFSEKLLWLKLYRYMNDPLVIQCADKYRVREYVESAGCGECLNELIGVYEDPEDIPWDKLPNQFVLKWNFGAGMNLICSDKSKLNYDAVIKQFKTWKKNKCWLSHSEMHYKYMEKRIVCEKYLSDGVNTTIPDYKVYCFHGEPLAILVMFDRGSKVKAVFFDKEWNLLSKNKKYDMPDAVVEKPDCLDAMLDYSEKLSKPFPFVRCDFYVVGDRVYFGELTFTPAGGMYTSQTLINGKGMEEYLHLN